MNQDNKRGGKFFDCRRGMTGVLFKVPKVGPDVLDGVQWESVVEGLRSRDGRRSWKVGFLEGVSRPDS